jgi:hypothetical protein
MLHVAELSRMFHVHEWVKPAVSDLLPMTLQTLTADHANQIGFTTYIMLCKAKEALEHEQKLMAHFAPPMGEFSQSYGECICQSHPKCRKAWRELWWKRVGKRLLHPDNPMATEEGVEFVTSMDWGSEITECCKQDMIEAIRGGAAFRKESTSADIVKTVVDAVVAFNKSLR